MLFDHSFKQQFCDIRCYDDAEVEQVLSSLRDQGESLFSLISNKRIDLDRFFKQSSIKEIQQWLNQNVVPEILNSTADHIAVKGIEALDPSTNYVFVSNHRDIAMDPLVINRALMQNGFDTPHNAIGENLLLSPLSKALAGLNKSFCISRSHRSPKAMLKSLKHQSSYISAIHGQLKESIWIAQREGRANDNNDLTNPALLKMLCLNEQKENRAERLRALHIVPVSICYEWDPCDYSKALRLNDSIDARNAPDSSSLLSKAQRDFQDVVDGLGGQKGRISLTYSSPVSPVVEFSNSNELFKVFANAIDHSIHSNYQLFPNNFAACDLLGLRYSKEMQEKATVEDQEIESATKQITARLSKYNFDINHEHGQTLLRLYAANVIRMAQL